MEFPLSLRFKVVSFSSKLYVTDATGALKCFVKKKRFKLKEHVSIFADEAMTTSVCDIKADRVIDFSAQYSFTLPSGEDFGGIARKGMRSIFKAQYLIQDSNNQQVMQLNEENGMIKVFDSLLGEVPILGMFTGYFFNPSYLITTNDGQPVFRIKKKPAFFESMYQIEKLSDVDDQTEMRGLMGALMMLILERFRG